jgi:hypothetical protein
MMEGMALTREIWAPLSFLVLNHQWRELVLEEEARNAAGAGHYVFLDVCDRELVALQRLTLANVACGHHLQLILVHYASCK